jgi:hypothetical protein
VSYLWWGFLREPHLNWISTFQIPTTAALAVGVFTFIKHAVP